MARIFPAPSSGGPGVADASGGTEATSGGYKYHTFTSSGSLTVNSAGLAEVLVISGGGGGGNGAGDVRPGGGGGAGGAVNFENVYLEEGSETVVIGAGGPSGQNQFNEGNNSSLGQYEVVGGGGGYRREIPAGNGACGGATGADDGSTWPGARGFIGFDGGHSRNNDGGAGGGGMGAQGSDGANNRGGNGGVGTNAFSEWATATSTGESGYYCGGGAGAGGSNQGSGGLGGGGNAGNNGGSGTANTGGGGAGARTSSGGGGGSGLVIVRYPV